MLYQQIARNKRKTVLVMFGFFLLVALIGAAIGYLFARSAVSGIIIAGVIAIIYMSVMIGQSTDVVMNMNNAREIHSASEAPELWHVVEDMAMVAQVPMPLRPETTPSTLPWRLPRACSRLWTARSWRA